MGKDVGAVLPRLGDGLDGVVRSVATAGVGVRGVGVGRWSRALERLPFLDQALERRGREGCRFRLPLLPTLSSLSRRFRRPASFNIDISSEEPTRLRRGRFDGRRKPYLPTPSSPPPPLSGRAHSTPSLDFIRLHAVIKLTNAHSPPPAHPLAGSTTFPPLAGQ
jgi:hypothetical protein